MSILVGVCIITLALLGCDLSDKPEQAVQTFFENSQSSDMSFDEIITEGIFSNLKLYEAEHRLLIDIKETLHTLHSLKNCTREIPPLTDYNEEYFNKFFLSLGSDRSKELIKFFGRVKNERNDRFKHKVSWFYSCIRDLYSPDVKYILIIMKACIRMMLPLSLLLMNNIL
ncbi:P52 family lipoprotein [Borreliella bavariensis]|uniref:P52 family lipoprotein n=1 Tax=Borreliella bavariensis TaxID=664662 RepID=UPI002D80AB67|nr:P52 family lipoprotein [Borreliella bavariensis]